MAVPMRAHHLLCMLSYSGEGYSPAFVHGFNGIVQRLGAGEPMELVTGPDAICAPLCNDACAHCHNASVKQRDRLAADALAPPSPVAVVSRRPMRWLPGWARRLCLERALRSAR